jgi:protein MpaA
LLQGYSHLMPGLAAAAAGAMALAAASPAAPDSERTGAGEPVRERVALGRSVRGRRISALRLGAPGAQRTVLVVGAMHGDEPAGRAVARELETGPRPRRSELWVLRDLNPDGSATGRRQNARGVDLNRNFPHRWERRRGRFDSGPRPLSEPESRIAHRLIRRIRPDLTIWLHQPYGIVVDASGDDRVERRVARLFGLPHRRLGPLPGTAVGWQNRAFPDATGVVVELGPGRPEAQRYARAVQRLAP